MAVYRVAVTRTEILQIDTDEPGDVHEHIEPGEFEKVRDEAMSWTQNDSGVVEAVVITDENGDEVWRGDEGENLYARV